MPHGPKPGESSAEESTKASNRQRTQIKELPSTTLVETPCFMDASPQEMQKKAVGSIRQDNFFGLTPIRPRET
jgi:hypothetical protein